MLKYFFKKKKRAIVFVDYENWYLSYKNLFEHKPRIKEWYDGIKEQYDELDIYFYANFDIKESELLKINEVTNNVVQTPNSAVHKKNMVDFIMLDDIYQKGNDKKSPNTFIIFSGDGHFQSVVEYLRNVKKKNIIVYGVRGAFSNKLKTSASQYIEIPYIVPRDVCYIEMVIQNMKYLERHGHITPTFLKIAKSVSLQNHVQQEEVEMVMKKMIEMGYLSKRETYVHPYKWIHTFEANWILLNKEGYRLKNLDFNP